MHLVLELTEEEEIRKLREQRAKEDGKLVQFGGHGGYDDEIYGSGKSSYVDSIPVNDMDMEDEGSSYTPSKKVFEEVLKYGDESDPLASRGPSRFSDRDNDYTRRRFDSRTANEPARRDPLGKNESGSEARGYREILAEKKVEKEEKEVKEAIRKKLEEEEEANKSASSNGSVQQSDDSKKRKRRRWDETPEDTSGAPPRKRNRWDETPTKEATAGGETPKRVKSRWDETPVMASGGATPLPGGAATPFGNLGQATPIFTGNMTPSDAFHASRWAAEVNDRNRPWVEEELNAMLPETGYEIVQPPAGYAQQVVRKYVATPTPQGDHGFMIQEEQRADYGVIMDTQGNLPDMKPGDEAFFRDLIEERDEDIIDPELMKKRKIKKLLLKIKNGTPAQRKQALRQITDKAREFGPGPLFEIILPLLMVGTLEDQERHLLVKVIDRILYKLDDLVRPYVHQILVVIEPLLIDKDYYAQVEGREIISNLAKAAGLVTMITTMRPDIDNPDEYVRNSTAKAFSIVASALGIPSLLPFLKAVCHSKKSWEARHTGIKTVSHIAVLMRCAILPHLKDLVDIIKHGLDDEFPRVRTVAALALAALAESAAPYGIESFDDVLRPLWHGVRAHRGPTLGAFLKAIGFIIPLMDAEYASYYTEQVMAILIREFGSPDQSMKIVVLKVIKQCVATEGVQPKYVREKILPEFFKQFWIKRMALDKKNYQNVVETTVELANNVGGAEIISRIVGDLTDESEAFRKMIMETIEKIVANLGVSDIDVSLEKLLIDGMLFSFQEQNTEDALVLLNCFGTVINALNLRVKPYLNEICSLIRWRLTVKSAKYRQQAADLTSRIAVVMKRCGEEDLMSFLGQVLYEYLGEEYPEVLGSILGALKAIVNVIGMTKMVPPIKDLLPRLTPILRNRHEKVQENCIDLVGRIADRGAEFVSPREWMRICFELLEMLKAHKKGIRRATVNTFGYIAKAIGPQDVLHTLLNNLRVQERQNRVCTTVAIAIVAETCLPFTVLPALMNEYRVPELNVQNGVLKALSFLFEYISEMGKDYIYAVTPLLEDALMDRDLVHRQTACSVVKRMLFFFFF